MWGSKSCCPASIPRASSHPAWRRCGKQPRPPHALPDTGANCPAAASSSHPDELRSVKMVRGVIQGGGCHAPTIMHDNNMLHATATASASYTCWHQAVRVRASAEICCTRSASAAVLCVTAGGVRSCRHQHHQSRRGPTRWAPPTARQQTLASWSRPARLQLLRPSLPLAWTGCALMPSMAP